MPLLDHFHPPLYPAHDWHSFHQAWATTLAFALNQQLPPDFSAAPNIQYGIEIDVATFENNVAGNARAIDTRGGGGAAAAVAEAIWSPPSPTQTIPLSVVSDVVRVEIFHQLDGRDLAGAIELVSPANKDRPGSRDAFVSKCAAYVQHGLGLVVLDVVTERRANLHDEFLRRLRASEGQGPAGPMTGDPLYAAAYHPLARGGQTVLDIWHSPLALGQALPTMPLWLRDGPCVPLELEAAYQRTCAGLRINPTQGVGVGGEPGRDR